MGGYVEEGLAVRSSGSGRGFIVDNGVAVFDNEAFRYILKGSGFEIDAPDGGEAVGIAMHRHHGVVVLMALGDGRIEWGGTVPLALWPRTYVGQPVTQDDIFDQRVIGSSIGPRSRLATELLRSSRCAQGYPMGPPRPYEPAEPFVETVEAAADMARRMSTHATSGSIRVAGYRLLGVEDHNRTSLLDSYSRDNGFPVGPRFELFTELPGIGTQKETGAVAFYAPDGKLVAAACREVWVLRNMRGYDTDGGVRDEVARLERHDAVAEPWELDFIEGEYIRDEMDRETARVTALGFHAKSAYVADCRRAARDAAGARTDEIRHRILGEAR